MPTFLDTEQLDEWLQARRWSDLFDSSARLEGESLTRGRLVREVAAEILETGDAELSATVFSREGASFRTLVAIWKESGDVRFEGDCSCGGGSRCSHAFALLAYLSKGKGARLEAAFGKLPHAERMTGVALSPAAAPASGEAPEETPGDVAEDPAFYLRVEPRPEGDRFAWLPETFATAWAVYAGHRVPLSPSGHLTPLPTGDRTIPRKRTAETTALNLLYALDLVPGAEEPPASLRKIERLPHDGPLWTPDREKWPHLAIFWQKFRHEAVPALTRRGWDVRFAPGVGHKPLVFRSESWRAEIVDEGKGWFHLSAGFEIDGEEFELQPILAALLQNRFLDATKTLPDEQEFLVLLPDGRGLALPVGRFRRILTTLGELTAFSFSGEGPIRIGALDAATVAGDTETFSAEVPPEVSRLSVLIEKPEARLETEPPSGLRATLRSYQLAGFQWMQFLAGHGLHGILADDMGLGKTLQTLTHLLAELDTGKNRGLPSLVVAPTSVVQNWQREAARFTPALSVLVLQGAGRKPLFSRIPDHDLVVTSYALLVRDLDRLARHDFHCLILDEAQHIKNPSALTTQAAGRLVARHRLCLSGTPVENHLGELWSLMHFLQPGLLGSWDSFREQYRNPIERDGSTARAESLARRVAPLILRRTKNEVAKELPPKTESEHLVEMTEAQKDLYETVRSTMDKRVRQALAADGNEAQVVFLDALLKLRQICCHPRLLDTAPPGAQSAKFDYFVELLETLREERHRVLVFSQFTSMLALLEEHLRQVGCSYLKLTGETRDRQELVERFQEGIGEVFLISLKAGGTGLTLTGADTVIHYDPWWNPAVENQATDRAYRIGQDKPVIVHRLICRNTVEERIRRMQEKKGELAGGLFAGTATAGRPPVEEWIEDLLKPSFA